MDDVIVVGGRCAGAPTAMLLAKAGFKIRVIERSLRLGDTLSGHMIKPAGAARLHAWGLLDTVLATGCTPIGDVMLWVGRHLAPTQHDGELTGHGTSPKAPAVAPRRGYSAPLGDGSPADPGNAITNFQTPSSASHAKGSAGKTRTAARGGQPVEGVVPAPSTGIPAVPAAR